MFDTFQRYIFAYKRVEKLSSVKKNLTVIDVGANDAGFARYSSRTINLTNIDIKKFDQNLIRQYPNVKFLTYDGKRLPFKNASFDIVLCIDTLEHIPSKQRNKFIKEILRISKHEVLFTFPISSSKPYELFLNLITFNKIKFLREHFKYGLPNDEQFQKVINGARGYNLKKVEENINIILWIPLKLLSSIIYKIFKNNTRIERKLFLIYKDFLGIFINFGRGYSKTYWIVKDE